MIEKLFRKDLKDLKAYKVSPTVYSIRLDANESFFNIKNEFLEEMTKELESVEFNRYPDSSGEKIRYLYGKYAKVDAKNLIAGNGSDELIQLICNTFLDRQDKILMLEPDFSMYKIYAQITGAQVVTFLLEDDFNLDVDKFIETINKENPKIVFFSNPNNPVGNCIPKDKILKIVKSCESLIVVDEAYFEFCSETVIDKINDYENLIVLRTCSKALAMAGLRLGFLAANELILNEINKVKSPFNVNSLTQVLGKIVLKKEERIKEWVDCILRERDFLIDNLKEMKSIKVYPSFTNFVLIEVLDSEGISNKFLENGIAIRSYGSGRLKNCLRITVGNRKENIKFLEILSEVAI